jgi:hypothetical protein
MGDSALERCGTNCGGDLSNARYFVERQAHRILTQIKQPMENNESNVIETPPNPETFAGEDSVDQPVRLSVMHAVYVRDEGREWQLFSGELDLECAKTTASMLEVTRPNSDVCIVPPCSTFFL